MRPSPTMRRVRGSASAPMVLVLEEARRLDHLGRDLEHVGVLDRMRQRRAERDAAAEAENGDALADAGCSSSGTCASRRCVSMSPEFEASTLPSMASDVDPASRRTATVPRRSLAVVEQLARAQRRRQIGRSQRRGVLVGAAREQQSIPRRQQRRRARARRPRRPTPSAARACRPRVRAPEQPRARQGAETTVTARMVPCSPSQEISTKPASSAPAIAPAVLTA